MNALIVVPVFNEADTVGDVVAAARAYAPVLVVDDGSSDGSAEIARRAGAEVSRHPRRLGKGQAIRTGIDAARARLGIGLQNHAYLLSAKRRFEHGLSSIVESLGAGGL